MKKLYFAGPLFGAADRLHNLILAECLEKYGYDLILPQIDAERFRKPDGGYDQLGIYNQILEYCKDEDITVVANLDGPDADADTAVEIGLKVASGGRCLVYRTDFRTDPEHEIGSNLMFSGAKVQIYFPVDFASREGVEKFYDELATRIHEALEGMET